MTPTTRLAAISHCRVPAPVTSRRARRSQSRGADRADGADGAGRLGPGTCRAATSPYGPPLPRSALYGKIMTT